MHAKFFHFSLWWFAAIPSYVSFGADLAVPSPAASAGQNPPPAITTVAEASARWVDLRDDNVPVRIEGVITGTMPSGAFRLHDGNLGIFATRSAAGQKLTPGDHVTVTGVLRQGGFSPWITPREIVHQGQAPFPAARPGSYSLLASGTADNQWLEIEGVVRAAELLESGDFISIDLGMPGGNLRVLVNPSPHPDLESLVDARVRLRGVASVNVNKHGHVVEPSFRVPSFAEIAVTQPASGGPFYSQAVPFARIMRPAPDLYHHRVRTGGVVTRRVSDTVFFLREGGVGLKVVTRRLVRFQPGDVIDAAGFPVMADGLAVLEQSIARMVASGPPPTPVRPELGAMLEGTHNSDLVSMQARLVDWSATGRGITLIFQAGDRLFKGLINQDSALPSSLPEKNSLVNVVGICVISELEDIWFYQPKSFLLLVASLADLELLQAPPWWTPERLGRALAITGLVLLAAAGWVWSLRRQIERKRAVIEQQARHAAALEERTRIARELHDTLEQGLTGLSLQMKAIETDLNGNPHPARARMTSARQMLRQSRALAHNAIRELRSEVTAPRLESLRDRLQRVVDTWNHSGALTVELRVVGTVRPLPPRVENHLLGIGTESMTNAVKHGRAEAIQVELDFRAAEVALRVKDNGAGFDPSEHLDKPAGCFGLLGMHERARELGGILHIQSRRGEGTEIIVVAPVAASASATSTR